MVMVVMAVMARAGEWKWQSRSLLLSRYGTLGWALTLTLTLTLTLITPHTPCTLTSLSRPLTRRPLHLHLTLITSSVTPRTLGTSLRVVPSYALHLMDEHINHTRVANGGRGGGCPRVVVSDLLQVAGGVVGW